MTVSADRLAAALAGRYRIERQLGQGGMATVYLAEDLKHHRKVAVKVLKPELAAVLGAERFVQEITTTAALQHPHILPLFDSGEAGQRGSGEATFLYYVMPFIDGETLRSKLDRETQLGIDESVRIATSVADALDYAHRHGVIHRDIKPENILLHDGRPMVADFGIALAVSAAAGGRMTETGLSLGTPHYMSPEQATAEKEITARSDVYSLGSVLYEMLTGSPPHVGASAQQIIMKIVTEEAAPVTKLRKAVPPNVAAAVAQSLEKLPADRFDTAKAFGEALTNVHFTSARSTEVVRRRAGGTGRLNWLTLGLGIGLVVMTLIAGWALLRSVPLAPVNRYRLAFPREQAPVPEGFALISSDGSRIVYAGPSTTRQGLTQLWVKPRESATATPLAGTDAASAAAVSPDNQWLAVVQGNLLRRLPIEGGAFTPLAENVSNVPGSVAWLDDGSIVYAGRDRSELIRIPPGGGPGSVVWSSDSVTPMHLVPLPDGRGILFHACRLPCDIGNLWALDLRNQSARLVVQGAKAGHYLATGHLLYIDAGQAALTVPFDLSSLESRGTPVTVMDSVAMEGTTPYFWVSPGGTVVMRSGTPTQRRRFELVWVDRNGRETRVDSSFVFRVTQYAGNHGWALSPDGARLAIGLSTASGDDIWIKALPRGPVSRVTYGSRPESRPRWTADGRSLTAVAPDGVILRRADGTGTDSILWPGLVDEALLSHDGSWLLLRLGARAATSGGRDIYGLRRGDSVLTPLVVTPYDENAIALSPDGRWLAYESDETGRIEVFIRPFPNTGSAKVQVSNGGGTTPLWARNGQELFFLRGDNTMMAVTATAGRSLQFGEPRALFQRRGTLAGLGASWYTPWDVAPDGRFIMVKSVEPLGDAEDPLIVIENWLEELKSKWPR